MGLPRVGAADGDWTAVAVEVAVESVVVASAAYTEDAAATAAARIVVNLMLLDVIRDGIICTGG